MNTGRSFEDLLYAIARQQKKFFAKKKMQPSFYRKKLTVVFAIEQGVVRFSLILKFDSETSTTKLVSFKLVIITENISNNVRLD